MATGRPRTGTVKQRADGSWEAAISTNSGRRRFWGKTREAALARAAVEQDMTLANTGRRPADYRPRIRRIVGAIIAASVEQKWQPDFLIECLVVQLSVPRIRDGIVGPCVYCGTWLADVRDHVIPISRGGSNDRSNMVSACSACNALKGAKVYTPRG